MIQEIFEKVSSSTAIPKELVSVVYRTYWETVREIMLDLKLKQDLTEEEFDSMRPNLNIPRLGKFYILYPKYAKLRESYKLLNE